MAQGIGQGIASGLRIGTQNALNLGALSLRKQRQDALNAAEANTFQPSISQQEEAFNIKQEENRANRDLAQANLKTALQEKANQTDFDSIENHALKRWGENQTPGMAQELAILVNTIAPETVIDGNFTTDGINQAFARATDARNPIPGGRQLIKNIFLKGVEESKNLKEAQEAELQKLIEKNPMLGTNPEALKRDKKAAPLAESIEELNKGEQQFRQTGVEIEQLSQEREEEVRVEEEERTREIDEMMERFQARVRGIETVQGALATPTVGGGQIGKVKVANFTLESLAIFEQTGNFEDLEKVVATPEAAKFQRQIEILNQQAEAQGVGQVSSLTREAILSATGFTAGSFKFLAKAFGSFIPGEQFPKTQAAINDINLGNQQIIAGIALSNKFPIKEVERIQKFLVTGGAFFSDPPFALRQYLSLRNDFELKNNGMLDAINSGTTTEDQTQDFIEKINVNNIALRLIPSRELLQSPKIFNEEQQERKAAEDLDFINSMTVEDMDSLTDEDVRALSPEAQDALINKLQTENISGRGASGGF